ncbi:MAG: hypothetical protein COU28_03365 [Candidatus Magasanikbacteria bacterium CG10_big_fil_rev_8_21_14_0_10_36_16]|uniref:Uncharacterized protein n=1 Tax=Candidatus Magasanikbacteria bacterium CG10_big_fil_rev_8_21_14_0_10_36_16 TaxID=1974645 RepID=A0A2H0TY01_9BACT|nr:MAG: hypothetical protein COU28_03365 [Candidatus Magasanikbacteria bacterium CG10_big_fil_rev_8_21_14_0_10_36_16]
MNKKIIYGILIVIITVAIVSSGVFFYNKYRTTKNKENVSNQVNTSSTGQMELIHLPMEPTVTPEWYKTDKDGDGLTDDEEDKLGTNRWESDSDFDGISDKLEIEKYKTDPMNPDTDGDGFRDGVEIMGDYDPLKK